MTQTRTYDTFVLFERDNKPLMYLKTFKRMLLAQNFPGLLLCLRDCPHFVFFLPGAGIVLLLSALVPPL